MDVIITNNNGVIDINTFIEEYDKYIYMLNIYYFELLADNIDLNVKN